jgi:2-desacetyl-2-hydroxyethyl bacteriochlorophyllide A dehydrogenase
VNIMPVEAQALICNENQEFSLEEVRLPDPGEKDLLIRTLWSGVSIGTEMLLVRKTIDWGPFPICLGYQAVGVVEGVGSSVEGFRPGDKVYHRGCHSEIALADGTPVSATSGAHGSHAIVDTTNELHGAAHMIPGLDEATASLFVTPCVGFHGVNTAGVRMGDRVAVLGAGLIGLGVVAAARLRGAHVTVVDRDSFRLGIAAQIGADVTVCSDAPDAESRLKEILGEGADVVFEATGVPACVDVALSYCRPRGKFVFMGNYGEAPLSFHFLTSHAKQLTAYFPSDDGYQPSREAVTKLIASGGIHWERTITHRVKAEEAAEFYSRLARNEVENVVGAVVNWEDA